MGRWGRRYSYNQWPEYVPVAERRAKAVRETEKLKKKGAQIQPVAIEGRTIARSFWGKGWCTHLESFGDYSNRLPRGRSYVRNGSVCHLGIARGAVDAMVAGSSLYKVKVSIKELNANSWKALKARCTGKIGSLIELLQGRLSDEIMRAVTDPEHGLFPRPGEIKYTCNCPDWADMCKHIAAVMYGIGARLDEQPELLFRLRGVDHEELLGAEAAVGVITGAGSRRARRRVLAKDDLSAVFGVDLESEPAEAAEPTDGSALAERTKAGKAGRKTSGKANAKPEPGVVAVRRKSAFKPTGRTIGNLRARHRMSKAEFARAVGVSAVTVANWEKTKGAVTPQAKGLAGLQRLHARPDN
jgi:uncharacterized Zn finger protein/DNA-binding transcriptional regulator YiaG